MDVLADLAIDYLSEVDTATFENWIATVRYQRQRRIDERAAARTMVTRVGGGRR